MESVRLVIIGRAELERPDAWRSRVLHIVARSSRVPVAWCSGLRSVAWPSGVWQRSSLILGLSVAALAQRRRGFGGFGGSRMLRGQLPNTPYDGRFTFVRINYDTAPGRLLVPRAAGLVARVSRRRRKPHEDHE